jgi:lipopolysaccharide biosynthesis glycosyltransferase
MEPFRVFIGWDSREDIAYQVARQSLLSKASVPVEVTPIRLNALVAAGAYTRAVDPLASTEFTYSRFLVPHLAKYKGWVLFCDCDFLFFGDVADLGQYMDERYAVVCVKHDYTPKNDTKMDGKQQTAYPRKNWSSFMLFNCEHPSVHNLTISTVNRQTGAYLHRMQWADDDEIGELPPEWNWLEGVYDKPIEGYPKAVHFTEGGPWFPNYQNVAYAEEWRAVANEVRALELDSSPA